MKKYILKSFLIVFLATSILSGCKKALETSPKNSLDLDFALNTREGIQATLVAIYNNLQTSGYYGRDFVVIPELMADNCEITTSNSNRFINQANNTPNNHVNIWAASYANINRCNIVLSYIDASQASAAEKISWKGEAYFLRALMYHNLVKTYARNPLYLNSGTGGNFDLGVPIITTPVTKIADITFPSRNKVSEVYDFIMSDLLLANSLLTNAAATTTIFRPRKVAAQALASRVELFRGNWAQAERWADSVIIQNVVPLATSTNYYSTAAVSGSWGFNHPETILGLSFQASETNAGTDCLQYIYYRNLSVAPTIPGYADVTMQLSLRNDMGVTGTTSLDQRFARLVSVQTKSSQQVFHSMKWPGVRTLGQDDIILFRTSEVLLNRAEARAMQGGAKEALAIADINLLKTRAGITPLVAPTGAALLAEIAKERRVELAFEGHRLFDLVRTGKDIVKNPASIVFGTNSYNFLIAPILQADVDASNGALIKNPGY